LSNRLHFSGLAEVLKVRDAGGVPCERVYQFAQGKLKAIEADIEPGAMTRKVRVYEQRCACKV